MKNRPARVSAVLLTGFAAILAGCNNNSVPQPAPIVDGSANDPATMNLATPVNAVYTQAGAPVPQSGGVRYAAAQQGAAPQAGTNYGVGNSQQNEAYQYNTQQPQSGQQQAPQEQQQYANGQPMTSQEYDQYAQLLDPNVPEATQPPPQLPDDYQQPEAPGPNYLWTPGYWDYASAGYYYVPGAWVGAPYQGALWTPGWWGYYGHGYRWHHGYWGPHVGYYGGINYGFGFVGFGYQGGYWRDRNFYYNTAVNHVSPRVVNNYVYQRNVTVVNNTYINNTRVSYFGGPNGLRRAPAPQEFAALREEHVPPMQAQIAHRQEAEANRQQFFNENHGRPQTLFAAHAIQADRNIAGPQNRPEPGQNFNNGRTGGSFPAAGTAEQRQQFEQQRQAQAQQLNQQRDGQAQRQQIEAQRQQQGQQGNAQRDQQRQQAADQQRLQQQQGQRQPFDAQRQQQENTQRQALDAQRQQGDMQRQQAQEQQRLQQGNQRQPFDAQRQQQENAVREQQAAQQRQQLDAQRQQQVQSQQRAQFQQQQGNAAREQQAAQQRQQMIQQQSMQQRPAAPAPRVETPRPAAPPAPHFEAPRAAPAPHVESHPAPAPAAPHR